MKPVHCETIALKITIDNETIIDGCFVYVLPSPPNPPPPPLQVDMLMGPRLFSLLILEKRREIYLRKVFATENKSYVKATNFRGMRSRNVKF